MTYLTETFVQVSVPRMIAKSIRSTNDIAQVDMRAKSTERYSEGLPTRYRHAKSYTSPFTVAFTEHGNEIAQSGDRGASGRVPAYA